MMDVSTMMSPRELAISLAQGQAAQARGNHHYERRGEDFHE